MYARTYVILYVCVHACMRECIYVCKRLCMDLFLEGFFARRKMKPICADATPTWNTSVTHCDVWVDCHGGSQKAGDANLWSTWWAMSGDDSAGPLRSLDRAADLDSQVSYIQTDATHVHAGGVSTFRCFLPKPCITVICESAYPATTATHFAVPRG